LRQALARNASGERSTAMLIAGLSLGGEIQSHCRDRDIPHL
jgi:hypothetical protein